MRHCSRRRIQPRHPLRHAGRAFQSVSAHFQWGQTGDSIAKTKPTRIQCECSTKHLNLVPRKGLTALSQHDHTTSETLVERFKIQWTLARPGSSPGSGTLLRKDLRRFGVSLSFRIDPTGDKLGTALGMCRWFFPHPMGRITTWHPSNNAAIPIGSSSGTAAKSTRGRFVPPVRRLQMRTY